MNWDAIGAIGEVVGAAAVFVSLLYLALQIRNSRRSDQIVAAAGVATAVNAWISQIVRDETLYDLYRRGLTEYETLNRSEKGRYTLLLFQLLRFSESGWIQKQMGVVDAGYWAGVEATLRHVFSTAGGKSCLAKNGHFFSVDFVAAVQKVVAEYDSTEKISHNTDADAGNEQNAAS